VGSLNVYARGAEAFSGSERDTVLFLALYAALALGAMEAIGDAGEQMEQLTTAMATRRVIGQDQGILMERHKVTAGPASGHRLGTVAVMDTEPHEGTAKQLATLEDLAAIVMDDLELRLSAMIALGGGH